MNSTADNMENEGGPALGKGGIIKEVEQARAMLSSIEGTTPWRFDEVQKPEGWEGVDVRFGALRTKDGKNVIQPFEGSASVIMGVPSSVALIISAPSIIQSLLDRIDELEA